MYPCPLRSHTHTHPHTHTHTHTVITHHKRLMCRNLSHLYNLTKHLNYHWRSTNAARMMYYPKHPFKEEKFNVFKPCSLRGLRENMFKLLSLSLSLSHSLSHRHTLSHTQKHKHSYMW